jgi:hypothetical protein
MMEQPLIVEAAAGEQLATEPLVRLQEVLVGAERRYSEATGRLEDAVRRFRGRQRALRIASGILSALLAVMGASQLAGSQPAALAAFSAALQVAVGVAGVIGGAYAYEDKLAKCDAGLAACASALGVCVQVRDAHSLRGPGARGSDVGMVNLGLDMIRSASAVAEMKIPII